MGAKSVFIKTNVAYDAAFTPNIGMELAYFDNWTVAANWMFANWKNKARFRQWKGCEGEVEVKWWLGKNPAKQPWTGHSLGIYVQAGSFDMQFDKTHGYKNDTWFFGSGISYGYALPIARNLKLDFGLGIGYLGCHYEKYASEWTNALGKYCHVWKANRELRHFGPTKVEISLVWCIYKNMRVNNSKKKGGRK